MEAVFILVVAGLTSVGLYVLAIIGLGFSASRLWPALAKVCECVGLALLFGIVNLAVATSAILAMRSLGGRFISLYIASDTTLLILSWFQALTFQAWRAASRRHHTSNSHGSDLLHRQP